MNSRPILSGLVAALALAALAALSLAKTQTFEETNEAEFSQGHAEGIVWTNLGTLRLGRAVESLLAPTDGVDYVARLAEAPDGTVYAVTGGAGRIYRMRGGKVDLFATLPDKFLFSCAVAPNGDLYVGSGGAKGRIWRITPQAQGEPKTEVFFEADDVKYIWDLACLKDGALAAATGDKGKVYRITPDKKGEVIISCESDHILCLAAAADGTLYAGTSGKGIVYRLSGKKVFVLYDADEAEVTALAIDAAGNLYVAGSGGTGGRGGAEIPSQPSAGPPAAAPSPPSPSPKGELQDGPPSTSPAPATKDSGARQDYGRADAQPPAVAEASGFAKASPDNMAGKPSAALAMAEKLSVSMQPSIVSGAPPVRRAGGGPAGAGSAVYRIEPDGIVARVFEGRDAMVLSLAVAGGRLIVGTGRSARVYEVGCQTDDEEACVASVDPKQVMSLLATRDGRVLAGSAGPGRLYSLSKGPAKEGAYTSQVFDAGGSARWGSLEWRGKTPDGTEIAIATRTGNVRDPDKGMWSEWSKAVAKSPASISSPAARFIQFRVTMRGRDDSPTPVLEQYEAAYLRVNESPKVLTVGEVPSPEAAARAQALERFRQQMKARSRPAGPGSPPQPASPPQPPPPEGPQPIRMIQWQVVDPNGDSLRFDLYVRGQGEPNWILLEKDLNQPQYAWDTATVADGWYELKVVASDRADNPAETALEAWKISDPVLVDNTPPAIEKLQTRGAGGGDVEVRFTVRDVICRLVDAAYTVDSATDWHTIAPTDGLFDGRQKEFRFTIRKLGPGPHRLAIRATDEAQNVGRAAHTLTVEK